MDPTPRQPTRPERTPSERTPPPSPTPPGPDERADLLLGGPLGRQLLGAFVSPLLEHTLFESLGLGDVPGTAFWATSTSGTGRASLVRRRKRREWHQVPAAEVRGAVRAAVFEGEWHRIGELTESDALTELASESSTFGFMGSDEAVWGLSAVAAEELRPVATALAGSTAASRWWEPVQRADQRQLVWSGDGPELTGIEDAVRQDMARERAENARGLKRRPRKGERNIGAIWWSAPDFAQNTWTTGPREDLPTIELGHFIDTFAPFGESTATVGSIAIGARARVAEIHGPLDWQDLVVRFPRDVTGTHDGEWRTWADEDGPWYLPDWEAVAEHYDGVHVTVGGYLAACGRASPVLDGWTVLAGWVPDATLWLHDVATAVRRLGQWHGDLGDTGDWDDVRAGWSPDR
ncbi:hypothetical protein OHB04_12945 [Streptomyces sp. NBC_01775]|uniref:hypothetical protein n=1 Tax=Streptomyces sp. NBC_01775 TaxID=2975939 RepID=UPI002DDA4FC4|nr:hypothetical protein [Streptomyces sp. NBC_01775]WSB76603.1 hypothetical protein OHB04_12945 [Streptomyces sp. NBC_01775]